MFNAKTAKNSFNKTLKKVEINVVNHYHDPNIILFVYTHISLKVALSKCNDQENYFYISHNNIQKLNITQAFQTHIV
jgi:hypothetical protein